MRDGLVRGDLFTRPQDHYSALPNIVWGLGLTACELATYMYLIFRENRQTYRCHPSYEEIGRAIGRGLLRIFSADDTSKGQSISNCLRLIRYR